MKSARCLSALAALFLLVPAQATPVTGTPPTGAPEVPSTLTGEDGVKTYLLDVLKGVNQASADLHTIAGEYDTLASAHGGSPAAAAEAAPDDVARLVRAMREAYQRIDSYGYEYVEGIVAGVPSLAKYDVELDAGVPAQGAAPDDDIAPVVIRADEDLKLDHEGSLNNFLIEPTVFGTNERFASGTAKLPGFDKPVHLPNPKLVVALADYAIDGYARLERDASAWSPSEADCFQVVVSMTPTLADYFEEWKETKKSGAASGGRFVAVSRLSDMRGIMSSTRLAWLAVEKDVRAKDAALADKVTLGYEQILKFIDTIDAREQDEALSVESIDALGSEAKEKADALTVQGAQAAAVVGVDLGVTD
jgi:hypothetical protein